MVVVEVAMTGIAVAGVIATVFVATLSKSMSNGNGRGSSGISSSSS